MFPRTRSRHLSAVLGALLVLTAALPAAAGFLSQPADGDPLDIAMAYLKANYPELGLEAGDLAELSLSYRYETPGIGVTHLFFKQHIDGIEIVNGDLSIHVDRQGRILNLGNRLVARVHEKVEAGAPALEPETALLSAARPLGLDAAKARTPRLLGSSAGPAPESLFAGGELSLEEIPVRLRYYGDENGRLRLVWDLSLRLHDESHWWNLWVDAIDGEVVAGSDWIDDDSYRVFPLPLENPNDGDRRLVVDPANSAASPFAWHDTNGVAGAEFTDTRGNNVFAQEDTDGNNVGGFRPDGGPSLVFDFPLDLTMDPSTYIPAAVTNLFYWNNILHDLLFHYGFDEAAGNFQQINYTGAPGGGDAVRADAQDGSGTNNANFATPPDGIAPRMQMFIWTAPPTLTVNAPAAIAGDYPAGSADFGAVLDAVGVSGIVELVNDNDDQGGTASVTDGCQALVGFTPGRVALIDRGACEFGLKVLNAENAGAVAAIVVNNQGDDVINMGGGVNGGSVTISSVFIGQSNGDTIKNHLAAPVDVTLKTVGVDRDSDLDNGIIAHEYGHGLSNRLTGGRLNVNCLNNTEQAGEGWSDWMTLVFNAHPTDTAKTPRGIGTYVIFEPTNGQGIRNFPYTTDLTVNPQTYADVATTNIPHGVGEIWASMLWEMYWRLVERDGFSKNFYTGGGGNNQAMQLTVDGLKLQSCSPGFVDARDAIIQADLARYGGINECVLWKAFAKRGLGFSASQGTPAVGNETEAFDIPASCQGLVLSTPFPGVANAKNKFVVTGASPSQKITLVTASQTGSTTVNISGCGPVTFGLAQPLARAAVEGTSNLGDASLILGVEANMSGQTASYQVFDHKSCSVSNVVTVTYP